MQKYKKRGVLSPHISFTKSLENFFSLFLHNLMFIMKESLSAQHEEQKVESET